MSCCGFNNNCGCNTCRGVRLNQFDPLSVVSSGTKFITDANQRVPMSSIERYLQLQFSAESRLEFSSDTDTATLGFATVYACTDTSVPRTLTISTSDIAGALPTVPWFFIVVDESGGAATNNITVTFEGGQAVDRVISANQGVARLYSNGTNVFSR